MDHMALQEELPSLCQTCFFRASLSACLPAGIRDSRRSFLLSLQSSFCQSLPTSHSSPSLIMEMRTGKEVSSRRKEEIFITFSPKFTAVNAGVSVVGILLHISILPQISLSPSDFLLCHTLFCVIFGILPTSILGLLLTLVATFSNQCNCFESWCCSCCSVLRTI